jgi:hypothetical protein
VNLVNSWGPPNFILSAGDIIGTDADFIGTDADFPLSQGYGFNQSPPRYAEPIVSLDESDYSLEGYRVEEDVVFVILRIKEKVAAFGVGRTSGADISLPLMRPYLYDSGTRSYIAADSFSDLSLIGLSWDDDCSVLDRNDGAPVGISFFVMECVYPGSGGANGAFYRMVFEDRDFCQAPTELSEAERAVLFRSVTACMDIGTANPQAEPILVVAFLEGGPIYDCCLFSQHLIATTLSSEIGRWLIDLRRRQAA